MPAPSQDRFSIVAEKLIYGGAALAHHDLRTVLVPYALPGEQLAVEKTREAKGVVHARILEVNTPSPQRIAPRCPWFARCGGCHYQQFDAAHQAEAKREILRETLRRIGHIDWKGEIGLHAAEPWGYRNQFELKVGRDGDGRAAVGFFAAESHRLVPVDACVISSPKLNEILRILARSEWVSRLPQNGEVELLADDRDEKALLTLRAPAASGGDELLRDLISALPGLAGAVFEPTQALSVSRRSPKFKPRGKPLEQSSPHGVGLPRLSYRIGDFQYEIGPGSFFQASRFLLPEFVRAVTEVDAPGTESALDLYAGVGLFTLPLARRFARVAAVESNPRAVDGLRRAAGALGLGNIQVSASRVEDFLRRYGQRSPALVVLDPPRVGAGEEALRHVTAIEPERIHYASCQPATLARDLRLLVDRGYQIIQIDMFDLFPQTYHIESLVKLRRDGCP